MLDLPRIALIAIGLVNVLIAIGFSLQPEKSFEIFYGAPEAEYNGTVGAVAISNGHGCAGYGLVMTALVILVYRDGSAPLMKVVLLSNGIGTTLSTILSTLPPYEFGKSAAIQTTITCVFLTALSFAGAYKASSDGYESVS